MSQALGRGLLVGMTYDLRDDYLKLGFGEEETAEFDRLSTIEAIESTLQQLGFRTDRIGNVLALTKRLAAGARWDLVFNISEGLYGLAREAQVPALLDAHQIPYTFSDATVLALTLDKALTKRVIRDLGLRTPEFLVVSSLADLKKPLPPFPLFAKPIAEGTGKGIDPSSKIADRSALERVCAELLARFKQPVLVEAFLPGREFTVGITGTGASAEAVAAMEVLLLDSAEKDVYSYLNKEQSEERCEYRLATGELDAKCKELALAVWRGLGCRDGGRIDIRCDREGEPSFIEINPLAGIHPEHSDLPILSSLVGVSYLELMKRIMASALTRVTGEIDKRLCA